MRLTRTERNIVRKIDARPTNETEKEEIDELEFDLEELQGILENHALPYFYFGICEGDGAEFGFWLSQDSIQEFDGLKVDDLSEVPTGYTGEVLEVNDHGNMSLYAYSRGRGREVWAIV
jgi:hypothetical protein